ncbi:MAG: molybdopterin-dependent oxidoreductase [Spirochaetales bacterium]|nr:molybdopterin-dependent oxidoreductase [Spirochaetales bacterium]
MEDNAVTTVPVSCNKDCGGGCALLAHVENGTVARISNNPAINDPMATGCARGFHMHKSVHSPERLTTPLVQRGERGTDNFEKIKWDEALSIVAEKLTEIINGSGAESIFRLGGTGACQGHVHNTGSLTKRFLSFLGKYTDQTGSYSVQATAFVRELMFGTRNVGMDPATIENTKLILLWGANISDTRFGSSLENWILKKKKDGIPVIVIDPRRSRSADRLATDWLPIYPGTDSAMMAAVLYTLIIEERIIREYIDSYSVGFSELEEYVRGDVDGIPKSPAWASKICGISDSEIIRLTHLFSSAKPAALIPGVSIQRTLGGEETTRFAVALQLAAGNIGIPGGSPGCNIWGRLPVPVCGSLGEPAEAKAHYVQAYSWPDAILEGKTGGYPTDIRGIYNVGGNYLSQGSDIRKNIRAFQAVDFSVCHDQFMTPTAGYCDIILPVTSFLERQDIISPISNNLLFSSKAIEPLEGCRDDYDIFCALAKKMGFYDSFSENRTSDEWVDFLIRESAVNEEAEFKRSGVFDGKEHNRIGLQPFILNPDENPLHTPSGKIEIASDHLAAAGLSRAPSCRITVPPAEFPLRMVTPHSRYRINSTNGNIKWFLDREEQVLMINPEVARKRGISDGQKVAIYNEFGEIHIKAAVSGSMMPGVTCLPQGAWPVFADNATETSGSPNMVTSTIPTEPSKGSRTHSVFIEISAV